MKLLIFGSLLVLASVVAWAAIDWAFESALEPARHFDLAPVYRFVDAGRAPDGTKRSVTTAWQTSTALEDCAELTERLKRDERREIAELMRSEATIATTRREGDPCLPFQLGQVEDGIKVQLLDECGTKMERVEILAGRLQGRQGCIEKQLLGGSGS